MVRVITIDGSGWQTVVDFLTALRRAIGAPESHGSSPDASIDSMIWGGVNSIEPPYKVQIGGSEHAPKDISDYIQLMIGALADGRADRLALGKGDVEVSLVLDRRSPN